jgi:general secretion pathway protein C
MRFNFESVISSSLLIKHAWVFNLIFLSLVLYIIVSSGVAAFIEHRLEPAVSVREREVVQTVRDRDFEVIPLNVYDVVIERNIFGGPARPPLVEPQKPVEKEFNPDEIPLAQRLRLVLRGTVVSENRELSRAVIYDEGTRLEEIFMEGSRIRNIELLRILRNQVIIDTGEREERLVMEMTQETGAMLDGQPALPARDRSASISVDKEMLESSLENLSDIMRDASISTYTGDDGTSGLQFSSFSEESIFANLGFQENDILVGVNDDTLSSPDQFFSLYQRLRNESDISLEIIRNGKRETLKYSIE